MSKKIAIFGIGISAISVIDYLLKNNREIVALDDNFQSFDKLKLKYQNNIDLLNKISFFKDFNLINWNEIEYLILSPSVPTKYPKPHQIVSLANKNNCKTIGDLELFYSLSKDKNFIGITGTNGKSTTTSLVNHIFQDNNVSCAMGGNIGVPVFDLGHFDNYIFEISSYQLDLSNKLKFNISALLNITPDHLDRYSNLDEYIKSKEQIYRNQDENDIFLINIDNINCYKIYKKLIKDQQFKTKIIPLSVTQKLDNSISLIDNKIYNQISNNIIKTTQSRYLSGQHNKQNILFAYAISYFSKISDSDIMNSISSFKGLKHRLQFLKTIDNISFINDSKATNIESAICALESYENIFWIAGGKLKDKDLSLILKYQNKINKAFLIGHDQKIFANFLNDNKIDNYICDNLDNAFIKAVDIAKKSNKKINILLSPACASFDQWSNFEERGDYFCKLVNNFNYG